MDISLRGTSFGNLKFVLGHMKGMSQEAVLARWDIQHQVDPDEDLNKLDDETLRAKKLAMDEIFQKNKLTPDDPNYVYDKEVNFDQGDKIECDWDDDDEEDDDFFDD